VRSALQGIGNVEKVELSVFSDVYTLTFRAGVTPDEATIQEVFKGCGFNGRKVVVEQQRKAVADLFTGVRSLPAGPAENQSTPARVELGRKLFFDTRLSAHGKMSCATCHQPEHGFAFPDAIAPAGFNGQRATRNVPTLINAGYRTSLFHDGRAKTLEEQALGPIQHPAEMGSNLDELVQRLAAVPEYAAAFEREFGGPITAANIAQALAAFERTLVSHDTPFDRYARGDEQALSESARRGYVIFRDKANCITCHSGPDFTDGAFRNIGVGWDGKQYKDLGRGQATGRAGDNGKFRVPTLRGLVWTAPYMHDGSLKTLEEVVAYYDRNGPKDLTTDLHAPLNLTDQEQRDLVEFLKSLSSSLQHLAEASNGQ
jgi:cytochrome c peroxidase